MSEIEIVPSGAPSAPRPPVSRLDAAAVAPNTRRAYASAVKRFEDWRAGAGSPPVGDATLARFVDWRFDSGASPRTISLEVSAVRFAARFGGGDDPGGPITARKLRGARREGRGRGRGQVRGIGWGQADAAAAVAANGGGDLAGLRDAAAIRLASDCLLRVSELAAVEVGDLEAGDGGAGLLTVRRSKTDQDGAGSVHSVGPPTMSAVRRWLDAAGIQDGPIFRRVRRGGVVGDEPITARSLRRVIQRRAAAAGVEGRVSGHSLRVGGAESIVGAGGGLPELMAVGRWRDPKMAAHYSRRAAAGRDAVARLRYGRGGRR